MNKKPKTIYDLFKKAYGEDFKNGKLVEIVGWGGYPTGEYKLITWDDLIPPGTAVVPLKKKVIK